MIETAEIFVMDFSKLAQVSADRRPNGFSGTTVDPKVTEATLLGQEGVQDASVWLDSGVLRAHVTLLDSSPLTERSLKSICMDELGLHQTPRSVMMILTRDNSRHLKFALAA